MQIDLKNTSVLIDLLPRPNDQSLPSRGLLGSPYGAFNTSIAWLVGVTKDTNIDYTEQMFGTDSF